MFNDIIYNIKEEKVRKYYPLEERIDIVIEYLNQIGEDEEIEKNELIKELIEVINFIETGTL